MAGWFCERDQNRRIKGDKAGSDGMDVDKCRQKMAETTVKQCIMNLSVEIRERVMKG
ncbi:hypothetical protein D3C84_970580 [compost metagenome]